MSHIAVQFVGGYADGTELVVDELRPNFYFAMAPDLSELWKHRDDLELPNPIPTRTVVYVLLEDTTIYIFKRIQYER